VVYLVKKPLRVTGVVHHFQLYFNDS